MKRTRSPHKMQQRSVGLLVLPRHRADHENQESKHLNVDICPEALLLSFHFTPGTSPCGAQTVSAPYVAAMVHRRTLPLEFCKSSVLVARSLCELEPITGLITRCGTIRT